MSNINNYPVYCANWIDSLASYFLNIKITDDKIENLRSSLCSQNNFSPEVLFQVLDYRNKNFLGLNDFKTYLNGFSFDFNEQHLRKFIHNYDKDNDFSLNFVEFLTIILPVKNLDIQKNVLSKINQTFCKPNITDEINNIFIELICEELKLIQNSIITAKICRESKGFTSYESFIEIAGNEKYITRKNLYNFLIRNGITISESDVRQLIFRIDSDNDGNISFREFEEIFAPVYDNISNNNFSLQCNENNCCSNDYKEEINDDISSTINDGVFTFGKNPLKINNYYSNNILDNQIKETQKKYNNDNNNNSYSLPYKSSSQEKIYNINKNNYSFELNNNKNYNSNKGFKEKKNTSNKYNNSIIFSFERNNNSEFLPNNYNEYNSNNYNNINYNNENYSNNHYNKSNNNYIINRTEKIVQSCRNFNINNYPKISNLKKSYKNNINSQQSTINAKTIDVNMNFVRNKNKQFNKINRINLINRTQGTSGENNYNVHSPDHSKQASIYNSGYQSPKVKHTKKPLNYDYSTYSDEDGMDYHKKKKIRSCSMTDITRGFRSNNNNDYLTIEKNENNENNELIMRPNISKVFHCPRNKNSKKINEEVKVNDINFYNYGDVAYDDIRIKNDNNAYFNEYNNYNGERLNDERSLIESSLFNRRMNKFY